METTQELIKDIPERGASVHVMLGKVHKYGERQLEGITKIHIRGPDKNKKIVFASGVSGISRWYLLKNVEEFETLPEENNIYGLYVKLRRKDKNGEFLNIYNNVTEIHYNYDRKKPPISIAIESDIHQTGCTPLINMPPHIKYKLKLKELKAVVEERKKLEFSPEVHSAGNTYWWIED